MEEKKRGPGRPRKAPEEMRRNAASRSVTLTVDTWDRLDDIATARGIGRAALMQEMAAFYLKNAEINTNERLCWHFRQIGVPAGKDKELLQFFEKNWGKDAPALEAMDEAMRIVEEARGGHRRIAFPDHVDKKIQENALKLLPLLLEWSDWPLVRLTGAGEDWIVDKDADQYLQKWVQYER